MSEIHEGDSGHLVRQLTSMDAQFLAIEDARNFSHISGLAILDPATAPGGTLALADLQSLILDRLHMLPPFRWRLAEVPFGIDHPWWVEDADFDIEFHVRELALPRPGNHSQLTAQVERIVSRPLDRSRPLWELYLVQGLQKGRVAVLSKIHHSVVDGVSGAEIMGTLFDLEASGRELPPVPEDENHERIPTSLELLGRGVFGTPRRVAKAAIKAPYILPNIADVPTLRALPGVNFIGRVSDRARRVTSSNGDGRVLDRQKIEAPRTMLNGQVSAHRRVSFGSLPLADVKLVKDAFGTKVNDVVVALSAGAVREFLINHDDLPDEPLVAMIPISVRTQDQIGTYGNRISMMIAPIPTDESDPVERLVRSQAEMSLELLRKLLAQGVTPDAVWFFSDLCYRNGMLFSPRVYREHVLRYHQRFAELCHEHDMFMILHCDGDVSELIPLLIEAGFDCIEPLEARQGNDVRELKPLYGDRISFFGNINMDVLATGDLSLIHI